MSIWREKNGINLGRGARAGKDGNSERRKKRRSDFRKEGLT
jgi:hypothetical protein